MFFRPSSARSSLTGSTDTRAAPSLRYFLSVSLRSSTLRLVLYSMAGGSTSGCSQQQLLDYRERFRFAGLREEFAAASWHADQLLRYGVRRLSRLSPHLVSGHGPAYSNGATAVYWPEWSQLIPSRP